MSLHCISFLHCLGSLAGIIFLAILPDLSFVLHERSAKSLGATRRPVLSGGLLSCHFHQ